MTDNPAPLTDPSIDVRNLDWFALHVEKLLASELWALSTGEEFKAAMGLWCRAWRQVPAGSLPNDDRVLASFAGVTATRWTKIKPIAMRGFVLCSDGRLYHKTLCEDARNAFEKIIDRRAETEGNLERKRRERDDRAAMFATLRAAGHVPAWNESTASLRDMVTAVTGPVTRDESQYVTALRNVTGQENKNTPPPPPDVSPREGTSDSPATTATALAKRVKGVDGQRVRTALAQGDPVALATAFHANTRGDRASEWSRETDGLQMGVIALIFAWMRWRKAPIREPSGFRKARAEWNTLDRDTRLQCNDLLEDYGIATEAEAP